MEPLIFQHLRTQTPNPRQQEFFEAEGVHIAYGGARAGGKSFAMRRKFVMLAMRYPGLKLILFRRTLPLERRAPGSFRAPGYPVVQVLFVLIAAAVVASTIGAAPREAAKGAGLIALGIPVYYWYARRAARA